VAGADVAGAGLPGARISAGVGVAGAGFGAAMAGAAIWTARWAAGLRLPCAASISARTGFTTGLMGCRLIYGPELPELPELPVYEIEEGRPLRSLVQSQLSFCWFTLALTFGATSPKAAMLLPSSLLYRFSKPDVPSCCCWAFSRAFASCVPSTPAERFFPADRAPDAMAASAPPALRVRAANRPPWPVVPAWLPPEDCCAAVSIWAISVGPKPAGCAISVSSSGAITPYNPLAFAEAPELIVLAELAAVCAAASFRAIQNRLYQESQFFNHENVRSRRFLNCTAKHGGIKALASE